MVCTDKSLICYDMINICSRSKLVPRFLFVHLSTKMNNTYMVLSKTLEGQKIDMTNPKQIKLDTTNPDKN